MNLNTKEYKGIAVLAMIIAIFLFGLAVWYIKFDMDLASRGLPTTNAGVGGIILASFVLLCLGMVLAEN
jgi:hypothetical protein